MAKTIGDGREDLLPLSYYPALVDIKLIKGRVGATVGKVRNA
ncbi:hypothetical protein FOYG_02088 [Fusarium oxysporum NRRL 32931]|uniref:Uncharacterized protein n=1 Tax=Fusarium oxysporum NRRL 32931 TaxID=660029 RepID=W9JDD3_FUSOX|nr:hypothetical protein FOYG_02088 [Fusarium oxysporum NRRL 32931]